MSSVDELTAAELLHGLPSRVHEVYAPFVRDIPDHPAFVEGGRSWSYRQFSEAVDATTKNCRFGDQARRSRDDCEREQRGSGGDALRGEQARCMGHCG